MKYEYYVIGVSTDSDDEREILKTNDKEDAIKTAQEEDFTNKRDGNAEKVEIRIYEENIEDEDCECFDYNTLDYKLDLLDFIREAEENNHDHEAWEELYSQYLND